MSRRKILLIVVMTLICGTLFSQQNYYSVRGKNVVSPSGEEFIIKGVNLGNWLVPEGYMFKFKKANSPRMVNSVLTELIGPAEAKKFWIEFQNSYITRADIEYLKKIGANTIRAPFNYKLFCDETYLWNTENRGFELFDKLLDWCRDAGIAVIFDMHCAPGGQTGDNIDDSYGYPWLFESPESQKLMTEIWRNIAERYADDPIVLGYGLMNEPIAHYFSDRGLNEKLEPLCKKLTAAIREVDKNHIVILGGSQWNTNFHIFGKPFDDKLVYEFHKYWMPPVQKEIQQYLDFRDKWNVPIYMGESGENKDEWVNEFRMLLDKHKIGWTFWPYKKMNNTAGPVNFKQPDDYDYVIEYAESDRSTYKIQRENKPEITIVKGALSQFLENSRFGNCFPNEGYIRALGFEIPNNEK